MFKYYFEMDQIEAEVGTTRHAQQRILQRLSGEDPTRSLYRCFSAIEKDEAALENFMFSLKVGSKFGLMCNEYYCMILSLDEIEMGVCRFTIITVFNEDEHHFDFFGGKKGKCDFACAVNNGRVVSFSTK